MGGESTGECARPARVSAPFEILEHGSKFDRPSSRLLKQAIGCPHPRGRGPLFEDGFAERAALAAIVLPGVMHVPELLHCLLVEMGYHLAIAIIQKPIPQVRFPLEARDRIITVSGLVKARFGDHAHACARIRVNLPHGFEALPHIRHVRIDLNIARFRKRPRAYTEGRGKPSQADHSRNCSHPTVFPAGRAMLNGKEKRPKPSPFP